MTSPGPGSRLGALDLDVSPEKAEIWLDGYPIGVADDFDGFPNYLWLEQGTYDVVIYFPGYRTIARQYSIYPGLVIDVEDRMARGESIHPNDLPAKTHERRNARLRRDREMRERVERASPETWSARAESAGPLDARGEPSRIRLNVTPEDASVYLDGRFLGTGRELGRLRAGLLVDPGDHLLEVVRPGYESSRRTVAVEAGAEESVEVDLTAGG